MRGISLAALLLALLEVEAQLAPTPSGASASASVDLVLSDAGPGASAELVSSSSVSVPSASATSGNVSLSLSVPGGPSASATASPSAGASASASANSSATATSLPVLPPVSSGNSSASATSSLPSAASLSASPVHSDSGMGSVSASPTWSESVAPPAYTGETPPGVAFNFTGMNLTYYYDNMRPPSKACAAVSGGKGWSQPILDNPSACGQSISQLHTDNVVALNASWLNQDNMRQRTDLCGREVEIWAAGKKLPLPTLFLYEACAACATMPRVDVSVGTYIAATGDTDCERGTLGGFDVLVLERKIPLKANGAAVVRRVDARTLVGLLLAAAGAGAVLL